MTTVNFLTSPGNIGLTMF